MVDKPAQASSVVWIVVAVLIGIYAWWLTGQVDAAQEQLRAAQLREQQLILQVQQLAVRTRPPECPVPE